jgi:hypothetical protein
MMVLLVPVVYRVIQHIILSQVMAMVNQFIFRQVLQLRLSTEKYLIKARKPKNQPPILIYPLDSGPDPD